MKDDRICPYCGGGLHEQSTLCFYCLREVNKREYYAIVQRPRRRLRTVIIPAAAAAVIALGAVFAVPALFDKRPEKAEPVAATESSVTTTSALSETTSTTPKPTASTTTHTTTTKATSSTTKKSVTTKSSTAKPTTSTTTPATTTSAAPVPVYTTPATTYVSVIYVYESSSPQAAAPETFTSTTTTTKKTTTTTTTTTTRFTLETPEEELLKAIKSEPALAALKTAIIKPELCRRAEDRCRQIEKTFQAGKLPEGSGYSSWLNFVYSVDLETQVSSDCSYEIIGRGFTNANELLYSEKENYPGLVTYLNNCDELELGKNIDYCKIDEGGRLYKPKSLTSASSRQKYIGIAKVGSYWVIISIAD